MKKAVLVLCFVLMLSLFLLACDGGSGEDGFELPPIEGLERVTIEANYGYMHVMSMLYVNWLTEQGFSWDDDNFDATNEIRREAERILMALYELERELELYPEHHHVVATIRNAGYFSTVLELLYRAHETRVLPGYFCGPWQLNLTFYYAGGEVVAHTVAVCSSTHTDVDLLLDIPEFMAMITIPPELSAIIP